MTVVLESTDLVPSAVDSRPTPNSAPVPPRHVRHRQGLPVPDGLASTINALFAVGLDLAAVRGLVDEVVGSRIDGAIVALDDIISSIRSQSFAISMEPGAHRDGDRQCR